VSERGDPRFDQLPEAAVNQLANLTLEGSPPMSPTHRDPTAAKLRGRERGQVLAIGAVLILTLIFMSALILEGGNAYAQQRVTQNGSDAAANAGAVILAQRLGGYTETDADVLSAVTTIAGANSIATFTAEYTDINGKILDSSGAVASSSGQPPAVVGQVGSIPTNAAGVHFGGTRSFGTLFGRSLGFNSIDASADATAVTGRLLGGAFLPVIFPVSISACDNSGVTEPFTQDEWTTSSAPASPGGYPTGPEYIIPLCKTNAQGNGGGSFQILDLDPNKTCLEEVQQPPFITWTSFPVQVHVDVGNNCAKPIADEVNANLHLKPVLIPICQGGCVPQGGGNNAYYDVVGVTAFYIDYMFDSNSQNNPDCQGGVGSGGDPLINVIEGNGSSSCVHGWFVQIIRAGPVGSGTIAPTDSIGVQLIK
jgi:Flp pilus assembly protein TadG